MARGEKLSVSAQGADTETKVGIMDDQPEKEGIVITPGGIVDVPVTVISLSDDPYHEDGHEFQLGKKTADELVKRGWVEIKKEEKKK
jgi:hypothetical protein